MYLGLASFVAASTSEGQETFCEGDGCIPDTLELQFEGGEATLELASFEAGAQVPAQVVTDTQTARIQGWSYGVRHDPEVLSIVADSATTLGTIAHPDTEGAVAIPPGFDATQIVPSGFISAVVLAFLEDTELPTGQRSAICNVVYQVDADPGSEGTSIEFVSGEVGPDGSPPTDINFTVDGASRQPATIVNGTIRVGGVAGCEAPDWAFYFGPAATTEAVDLGEGTSMGISMRNTDVALAFQLGVSFSEGVHSFSESLGADDDRLIDVIITDAAGDSQDAATPNTLLAPVPSGITRGPAIASFQGSDFFAIDLVPAVGGPGYTVGYVADLDGSANEIPAVADDGGCGPNNVVLVLGFEAVGGNEFIRGDLDGDGRYSITDAVLVIQTVLMNLPRRFDCEDAVDASDDGVSNISDAMPILMYLFQRGQPIAAPFLECGPDATEDGLDCAEPNPACAG